MSSARLFASALALSLVSASAFADTTVYTSSSSFLADAGASIYTETFDGLDETPEGPMGFSSGAFSYDISAPGYTYASGDFLGTSLPNEALTISFLSGNVYAVGGNFFAVNLSDAFQSVQISLSLSDGTTVSFTPTSQSDSFRGFVSDTAITSLTIGAPGVSLYGSVDNLTVGIGAAAVPEPASWALAALGLVGVAAAVRRRLDA